MIQVAAQRANPAHHLNAPAPNKGLEGQTLPSGTLPSVVQPFANSSAISLSSAKVASPKPQFGGALGTALVDRALIPVFQNITEVFLWGFLAQDMVAMWMPRIETSLRVGRVPYDPQEDPEARNLPFHQQVKKWITGNIRGLNWVNFNEETKREIATGPGLLTIPALAFMTARHLGKNRPMELPFPTIEGLSRGFQEHLQQSGLIQASSVSSEAYRKALSEYVVSIFADPALKQTPIRQVLDDEGIATLRAAMKESWTDELVQKLQEHPVLKPMLEREDTLTKKLQGWFGKSTDNAATQQALQKKLQQSPLAKLLVEGKKNQPTYGDYLRAWADAWGETAFSSDKNRVATLETLGHDLQDALEHFNRKERICAYTTAEQVRDKVQKALASHVADEAPLHHVSQAWIRYNPGKAGKTLPPSRKDLHHVTQELSRWSEFVTHVWEQKAKLTAGADVKLPDMVEGLMKKLVARKFAFGMITTALAGAYLLRLAFWSQNHDSYQATRLLKRTNEPSPPGLPVPFSPQASPMQQPGGFQVGVTSMSPMMAAATSPFNAMPNVLRPTSMPMAASAVSGMASGAGVTLPPAFGQLPAAPSMSSIQSASQNPQSLTPSTVQASLPGTFSQGRA